MKKMEKGKEDRGKKNRTGRVKGFQGDSLDIISGNDFFGKNY
jgi:hypothetical protein